MKSVFLIVLLAVALLAQPFGAGCLLAQDEEGAIYDTPASIVSEDKPYTLGRADVLAITVRNQPDFSGSFMIGPDGRIQYSYVGDITAAGLTKNALKKILIEKLKRYVKEPVVSIAITSYNSKAVYIIGEVNSPGKYYMTGDTIYLRDLVFMAGRPTQTAASHRVHIVKPDPKDPTYKVVNVHKMLTKGQMDQNFELQPGDIIVVPSTVLADINRTLELLLSPLFKAAVVTDVFEGRM